VRELSAWLRQHVVPLLNDLGVPIDLHGVQAALILLPLLAVAAGFLRVRSKKRKQMKDAGL
jgi:hypothetical protein